MWDQVFTSDKRLIGGRSQFIDSVNLENADNRFIEKNFILLKDKYRLLEYLALLFFYFLVIPKNMKIT